MQPRFSSEQASLPTESSRSDPHPPLTISHLTVRPSTREFFVSTLSGAAFFSEFFTRNLVIFLLTATSLTLEDEPAPLALASASARKIEPGNLHRGFGHWAPGSFMVKEIWQKNCRKALSAYLKTYYLPYRNIGLNRLDRL
uniref:Uncharacterized protein n=1 Tax=Romanomermis culicivorax TaxID=13658 RepID=A0A915JQN9_ROMCU